MKIIYSFHNTSLPSIAEVGGKAYSLIKMVRAGFNVPKGFVCCQAMFAEWVKRIEATQQWETLQSTARNRKSLIKPSADMLSFINSLSFTVEQDEAITEALDAFSDDTLYAIRSSSPEEDMDGSSFAGMYESLLGVDKAVLKEAIRKVFASAFDNRVFAYKQEKGFSLEHVKIAVIVMEQVNSDTSGVGFSVNPINNDYDEAVINANYGLGESIVSGMVTPDNFVVDKVNSLIISKGLGGKEKSIHLARENGGGTHERENIDVTDYSIGDDQAIEIAKMITAVEKTWGMPMDIEWAFSGSTLYMLQARPITTFIPLPPEMLSDPEVKKRTLYYDCSVLEGITTNNPITPITLDWTIQGMANAFLKPYVGSIHLPAEGDPQSDILFNKGVRMYINFSQLFFLVSHKKLAAVGRTLDKTFSETLLYIDIDKYLPDKKFPYLKWRFLISMFLKSIWLSRKGLGKFVYCMINPIRFFAGRYKLCAEDTVKGICKLSQQQEIKLSEYLKESNALISAYGSVFLPLCSSYMKNTDEINRMFKDSVGQKKVLADRLTMGLQGDEAIELGICLFKMSRLLPRKAFLDLDKLTEQCVAQKLPMEFMRAWKDFIMQHGMRGPNEMEIANPRYMDDPRLAFEQMKTMLHSESDPEEMLNRHAVERQAAYDQLMEKLPSRKARKLKRHFEIVNKLSSIRDTLKYLVVQINFSIRTLALRDGNVFAKAGRLDTANDVFFLYFNEIEAALADKKFDLQAIIKARKPSFEYAFANIKTFPVLIDSRGRIPSHDANDKQRANTKVLHGHGISRGKVRGPVKVLSNPREKTISKGEVLVAYTTDPGWTPLFIGSAGIILEIGAVLQHGGVVAREYSKPCVAGIRGITERLKDGQMVEVDGTGGTVTLLDE